MDKVQKKNFTHCNKPMSETLTLQKICQSVQICKEDYIVKLIRQATSMKYYNRKQGILAEKTQR
jgi:hypothetical protein